MTSRTAKSPTATIGQSNVETRNGTLVASKEADSSKITAEAENIISELRAFLPLHISVGKLELDKLLGTCHPGFARIGTWMYPCLSNVTTALFFSVIASIRVAFLFLTLCNYPGHCRTKKCRTRDLTILLPYGKFYVPRQVRACVPQAPHVIRTPLRALRRLLILLSWY